MNRFYLLILALLFTPLIHANEIFSPDLQKKLNFFERACDHKDVKEFYKDKKRSNRLLLIDATDPLNEAQIEYLKDNFIRGVPWQNEGEIFSIVVLNSKPISKLDRITMCSPMREDQITIFHARNKVLRKIKLFRQTLEEAFDVMVRSSKEAQSTRLVETLFQIYTNKRFNFIKGDRHLLIASDLFQKSTELSLFCNGPCPPFKDTLKEKEGWFQITKLRLRENDTVGIYYLQAKCKVDISTLYWWRDYFMNEGIKPKHFSTLAENNNIDRPCKHRIAVDSVPEPPGPIIDPPGTPGHSGPPGPIIDTKALCHFAGTCKN